MKISTKKYEALINQEKPAFEAYLYQHFSKPLPFQKQIFEAMNYSLEAGGKRLRPLLLLEAYRLCGGQEVPVAMDFACALEMIHTYSLIHDDLPAMDNDDFRRGKPTNHKVFGEGMAVLAGDGLLNYAYELMLTRALACDNNLGALKAAHHIATAAGVKGMIGGQVADLQSEGLRASDPVLKETLAFIHQHKTADLLMASVISGGYLARASEETMALLKEYGYHIGMAFQIVDDILDIVGSQEVLGKDIGSDLEKGKLTYPSLYGLEESTLMAKKHLERAKVALEGLENPSQFFETLVEFLLHREH